MLYCVPSWPILSQLFFFFFLTLLLPSLFWHPSSPFPVYFYIKHTNHFYPAAYKCTINELVVCNHRMWPKANSEQLLMCQPSDPIWQCHSSAVPTPQPEWWGKQEEGEETSHPHVRQQPAATNPQLLPLGVTTPEVRPLLCLCLALTDM